MRNYYSKLHMDSSTVQCILFRERVRGPDIAGQCQLLLDTYLYSIVFIFISILFNQRIECSLATYAVPTFGLFQVRRGT